MKAKTKYDFIYFITSGDNYANFNYVDLICHKIQSWS